MIDHIKIFGEYNSGNNYLIHLIRNNTQYDPQPLHHQKVFGWTHGIPEITEEISNRVLFIVLTKNPYSWLLSLHAKPYGSNPEMYKKMSFSEFLRISFQGCRNPIELWNKKHKDWYNLFVKGAPMVELCQYEELLIDAEKKLRHMLVSYKVDVYSPFKHIDKHTRADGDFHDRLFTKKEYYLQKSWIKDIGRDNIEFIDKIIDHQLAEYYGYRLHTDF